MALQLLNNIYKEKSSSEEVVLEFRLIEDLRPLVPVLRKFLYLKRLKLSGNRIRVLPSEFGQLRFQELVIDNNPLDNIKEVAAVLAMNDRLQNLTIKIQTPEEYQYLVSKLPSLKLLNNNPVTKPKEKPVQLPESCNIPQNHLDESWYMLEVVCRLFDDPDIMELQFRNNKNGVEAIKKQLAAINLIETRHLQAERNILQARFQILKIAMSTIFKVFDDKFIDPLQSIFNCSASITDELFSLLDTALTGTTFSAGKTGQPAGEISLAPDSRAEVERLRGELMVVEKQNQRILQILARKGLQIGTSHSGGKSRIRHGSYKESTLEDSILPARSLSLVKTKEMINEIMQSRTRSEETQSLAQYLFFYFEQKYGLGSLVIEVSNSLAEAIESFAGQDPEVLLFQRALRDEVDQPYFFRQKELRGILDSILYYSVREKRTGMREEAVKEEVAKKTRGQLLRSECLQMVNVSFPKGQHNFLLEKVDQLLGDRSSIPYVEFIDEVVKIELELRVKELSNLARELAAVKSKEGLVPLDRFSDLLLRKARVSDAKSKEWAAEYFKSTKGKAVKPRASLTFSQCVWLASQKAGRNPSLLQVLNGVKKEE